MNAESVVSIFQAIFCGGLCFSIAFIFERGRARYKFIPSLCAFALAALFGMQWLYLVRDMLQWGYSPDASVFNTIIFGFLLVLVIRARGNVSRIFDMGAKES